MKQGKKRRKGFHHPRKKERKRKERKGRAGDSR